MQAEKEPRRSEFEKLRIFDCMLLEITQHTFCIMSSRMDASILWLWMWFCLFHFSFMIFCGVHHDHSLCTCDWMCLWLTHVYSMFLCLFLRSTDTKHNLRIGIDGHPVYSLLWPNFWYLFFGVSFCVSSYLLLFILLRLLWWCRI